MLVFPQKCLIWKHIFVSFCSAPGSGPMFKSTTVTVRENCNEISQRAVVDSVNNQEDFKCTLIHSQEKAKEPWQLNAMSYPE